MTDHRLPGRPFHRLVGRVDPTWRAGVSALVATQAADVATTVVALRYVSGLEEANAVAAAVVAALGPLVGLTAAGLLAVGLVVGVTELGARTVRGALDGSAGAVLAVRLVGYGPLTALNVIVVLHNVRLVATACCPA